MKPNKTAPATKAAEPKNRFRLEKLEERIAPKPTKPFTWKCRPSW